MNAQLASLQTSNQTMDSDISNGSHSGSNDGHKDIDNDREIDDLIENSGDIHDQELYDQMLAIENCLFGTTVTSNQVARHTAQSLAITPMVRVITDYEGINQLECRRIRELHTATNIFNYNISDNVLNITDVTELVRLTTGRTEGHIREVIAFTKGLEGFTKCCADDQLSLVKCGCIEVIYMRGIDSYDSKTDCFNFHLVSEYDN
ncbi:unnamed protein product [Medioppia subpectinata]|uniref:Uncharacterized protein n=1 Tax=Medioppia subpectinata TaxID=1979941 RepID=A0A7R9L5R8_9ACAR|nr:unnamed protein product [Medioppia subpectinata]CAG2114822.1 unnamed protein product [Medioppia subpectinata]